MLSRVRLFATPRTVARQAPLSMDFSKQEYWCELPFHSPGDLPNPGIKPRSPGLQADSLPSEPPGKAQEYWNKPIPSPRDLPAPGVESWSPAMQAGSLPAELPGKPHVLNLELL